MCWVGHGAETAADSPNIWALGWIIWQSPSGPGVVGAAEGSVTNEGNREFLCPHLPGQNVLTT